MQNTEAEPFAWAWKIGDTRAAWVIDLDLPAPERQAIADAGGVVCPLQTLEEIANIDPRFELTPKHSTCKTLLKSFANTFAEARKAFISAASPLFRKTGFLRQMGVGRLFSTKKPSWTNQCQLGLPSTWDDIFA